MQYTVKKNRANRVAMRGVACLFLLIAVIRLVVVIMSKEETNVLLTLLLCGGGFAYGGYLMSQTWKAQAYDITYVFGDQMLTLKLHRGEKKLGYGEISELGYVVPDENLDYSVIQIYIGKEQYVLPFMGKSEAGKALYGMLKLKKEESGKSNIRI